MVYEKTEEQPSPDFKALHVALQDAIEANISLVEKVGYYSNQLKLVPPKNVETSPVSKSPEDVVSSIWYEIQKLRDANGCLNDYVYHLKSVIGDN